MSSNEPTNQNPNDRKASPKKPASSKPEKSKNFSVKEFDETRMSPGRRQNSIVTPSITTINSAKPPEKRQSTFTFSVPPSPKSRSSSRPSSRPFTATGGRH